MTTGWRGNGTGNSGVTYIADGVSFNASANEIGAVFDVDPVNLQNAVLEMILNVSPEFKASGANLQPFAQVKEVWGGKWCDIPNSAFNASEDYVATCTLDDAVLNQTVNGYQVGVQANGTSPTGVVTIKSAKVTLATQTTSSSVASSSSAASTSAAASSAPSNTLSIPVNTVVGWSNDGKPTTFSVNNGIVLTPDWTGAQNLGMFILDTPINLTNATVTYVISVPQSYITDGAMVIQPFSQQNSGDYDGIFDGNITGGWNPSSGLTAGDNTIVHGPFTNPPADIQRIGVTLNKQTMGADVAGDVVIKSITVNFPE
jgi:hypothetical protein